MFLILFVISLVGFVMDYELVESKSLLSKVLYADSFFHINRSLNAYRGCEFGCVYCDGVAEHYHVDDFRTKVRIKKNAADVLRRELKKSGFLSRKERGQSRDLALKKEARRRPLEQPERSRAWPGIYSTTTTKGN